MFAASGISSPLNFFKFSSCFSRIYLPVFLSCSIFKLHSLPLRALLVYHTASSLSTLFFAFFLAFSSRVSPQTRLAYTTTSSAPLSIPFFNFFLQNMNFIFFTAFSSQNPLPHFDMVWKRKLPFCLQPTPMLRWQTSIPV